MDFKKAILAILDLVEDPQLLEKIYKYVRMAYMLHGKKDE